MPESGQRTALVVDDSRVARMLLARELTAAAFAVRQAANGAEGLSVLGRGPVPDLVLVDWNMPEMNGLEFLRLMKAEPRWKSVPVLMVTSETEAGNMAAALEAGAAEYLMKPFTGDMLRDRLRLLGLAS